MFDERIRSAFDVLISELSELQGTYVTKSHVFHSLICALIHNRWGLPNGEVATGLQPTGAFIHNHEAAVLSLKRLAAAHEDKEMSDFAEYVTAASEGGN